MAHQMSICFIFLVLFIAIHSFPRSRNSRFLYHKLITNSLCPSMASKNEIGNEVSSPRECGDFQVVGITSDDNETCQIPAREFIKTANSVAFKGPSSHQVMLKWQTPPKRVLFLVKKDADLLATAYEGLNELLSRGFTVFVEQYLHSQLTDCYGDASCYPPQRIKTLTEDGLSTVDFIITFGGDGLLMHCNTLFGGRPVPPTMCFDFGSLGFLAPFTYEAFKEELDQVMEGTTSLTLRMRLECTIFRNNVRNDTYHVLNEAVIDRGPSPFLSAIELECDNAYLTTVQGDGLIIATPTGSTAYSLAAGGSMVHPSVPAILITPICAHTLSFRPVLLPDSAILSCIVPSDARSSGWVSFDGKSRQELMRGDRLCVKMSPYPMPTMNRLSFTEDWFNALRSQFMFNSRPRQKKL